MEIILGYVDVVIVDYVCIYVIELVVMGVYGYLCICQFIVGSIIIMMICSCLVLILLLC